MLASLSLVVLVSVSVSISGTAYDKDTGKLVVVVPVQQCVTCGWNGGCRTCVGGGSGANCDCVDCSTCSPGGICNTGSDGLQLKAITVRPPSNQYSNHVDQEPANNAGTIAPSYADQPLRLDPALIREVGAKHPRFGATLANRNSFGFLPGTRTIYWTPIEISSTDMNVFLNRKEHDQFFKKYNEKAREINLRIQKGEISEIVYKLLVERLDQATWTINLQLVGTSLPEIDPPYSSFELRLVCADPSADGSSHMKAMWEMH